MPPQIVSTWRLHKTANVPCNGYIVAADFYLLDSFPLCMEQDNSRRSPGVKWSDGPGKRAANPYGSPLTDPLLLRGGVLSDPPQGQVPK